MISLDKSLLWHSLLNCGKRSHIIKKRVFLDTFWKVEFILCLNIVNIQSALSSKHCDNIFRFCYYLQSSLDQLRHHFREVSDEGTGEQLQPCKHLPFILPGDRPWASTPAASRAQKGNERRRRRRRGKWQAPKKRDRVRWDRERHSTPCRIKDKG